MSIDSVSVIILTKNEATGIGATLARLADFDEVIVVDSFSTDETAAIARKSGARVVEFAWDGAYPKKKQWSLEHAGASKPWVLLLDADEFPSTSLVHEIAAVGPTLDECPHAAFDINLNYRFAGKLLRHGHVVTKRSLLDIRRCRFPEVNDLGAPGIREVEGHYQPEVAGSIGKLSVGSFTTIATL